MPSRCASADDDVGLRTERGRVERNGDFGMEDQPVGGGCGTGSGAVTGLLLKDGVHALVVNQIA